MRGNMNRRLGIAAGSVSVLLLAGACAGSRASATGTSAETKAAPSPAAERVLKGTALQALLLTADALPKGFERNPEGTRDSGEVVASASAAPMPPNEVCGALGTTGWIRVAGIGSAAYAQSDYVNADRTKEIAQEIDTFHGDDATKVMAALKNVFATCKTFTDASNGRTAKMNLVASPLSGADLPGIKAVLTTPGFEGGMTLVAVQVGNAVVTLLYSTGDKDKGADAVRLAKKIAENVETAG